MRSTPRARPLRARAVVLAGALALALAGCGDDGSGDAGGTSGATDAATDTDTDAATSADAATDTDTDASATDTAAGDPDGPWDSLDERYCPPESFLTYENFGAPFINSYCTGCHHVGLAADERQAAPLGVDLETIDKIRAQADRVWARSGDQNATMPPAGAAAGEERAMLGEWLACGAPTAADRGP